MINLFRLLAVLLALTTGAFAAPVGAGRALLSGGCPTAVLVGGACPTGPAFNFALGAAWSPQGQPSLTVTRASPPLAYAQRANGTWVGFPPNTARITDLGLLPEEARTNSIRNNSMQGAVVGSPGTLPTNWAAVGTGLTFTVIAIGVENGIDYIDIRVNGTTGSTSGAVRFETTTGIAALSGQTWTGTFFLAVVAGATTNISSLGIAIQGLTSGGVITTDNSASTANLPYTISSLSPSSRQAKTIVLADATDANIRSQLNLAYSSGVAIDVTFRLGWPQLELGGIITSPIRTTNVAVVRSQDVISAPILVGNAFSMYFEGIVPPGTSTNAKAPGGITDGVASVANSVWPYFPVGSTLYVSERVVNATVGVDGGSVAVTAGNPFKAALAFQNGDGQGAMNGVLQTAGTQAFPTGLNTLMVGQVAGRQLNSYLKRLSVSPFVRQSNASLQNATAP